MSDMSCFASRHQFGQTHWSMVLNAGKSRGDTAVAACNELLIHYHEAVYRYLVAKLNDVNGAGELFSRFAERVLEIHPFLVRADPEKGRFRNYLRAVLSRMVVDYYRESQRGKSKRELLDLEAEHAVYRGADESAPEDDFRKMWA